MTHNPPQQNQVTTPMGLVRYLSYLLKLAPLATLLPEIIITTWLLNLRKIQWEKQFKLRRTKTWKGCNDPQLGAKKSDWSLCKSTGRQRSHHSVRRIWSVGNSPAARAELAPHGSSPKAAVNLYLSTYKPSGKCNGEGGIRSRPFSYILSNKGFIT